MTKWKMITMADVAERAQSSVSAVSYVINKKAVGRTRVATATQERIYKAIAELGYTKEHKGDNDFMERAFLDFAEFLGIPGREEKVKTYIRYKYDK
jgi:hypothetical protein